MEGSKHFDGLAFDMRSKPILEESDKNHFLSELKKALGENYDAILEGLGQDWEHIHIEYDPKP
jgi:hypothetical protein